MLFAAGLVCTAMLQCLLAEAGKRQAHPSQAARLTLYRERHLASDLAVAGLIEGLPPATVGYVRRVDLAALPQVTFTVSNDEDFLVASKPGPVRVSGIYLADLAKALGASPSADLIEATCADNYEGNFPAEYMTQHHPVLGLRIDGLEPGAWAGKNRHTDPGPYFVTHADFIPAFKVLSHEDEAQVPTNVVRLSFSTTAATYRTVAPRGRFSAGTPEMQGFVIARQNCLRCHNQGAFGGTKSGRNWETLSTWAREQPAYFANYVRNPRTFETYAKMPANPGYDKPTLAALTAYFQTFTEALSSVPH